MMCQCLESAIPQLTEEPRTAFNLRCTVLIPKKPSEIPRSEQVCGREGSLNQEVSTCESTEILVGQTALKNEPLLT